MSQRRYAADHFPSCRWVASCELRRATCDPSDFADCTSHVARRIIVPRAMDWAVALHANLQAAIREPQSASCGPVASRSSQIAARSIEARHVLRHDCSSQSTARSSQTVAQAVPFLRSQRAPRSSQGADFCAGGPRLTLFSSRRIADRTVADRSTLARRSRQRSTVVRTLAVRWSQGAGV